MIFKSSELSLEHTQNVNSMLRYKCPYLCTPTRSRWWFHRPRNPCVGDVHPPSRELVASAWAQPSHWSWCTGKSPGYALPASWLPRAPGGLGGMGGMGGLWIMGVHGDGFIFVTVGLTQSLVSAQFPKHQTCLLN